MVNKIIKALVAALMMVPAGSMLASFNMNNCGVTAGQNVSSSGNSSCTTTASTSISGVPVGTKTGEKGARKRGDRVQFNKTMEQHFKNAKQLAQGKHTIYFPKAGAYAYHKLGDKNLLIATFDLAKTSHPGVPAQLQKIINAGKQLNYPRSQHMTWFGIQSTPQDKAAGIFTEVGDSYSSKGQNPGLEYERTGNTAVIYQNGQPAITIQ